MFEKFFSGKPEMPKPEMPSFDELKAALPEETRDEFVRLSEKIAQIAASYDGTIDVEELTSDDKIVFDRHEDLQNLAMEKLRQAS